MGTLRKTVIISAIGWIVLISLAHAWLNLGVFDRARESSRNKAPKFQVGFIPVTCHLTCPVTDFINKEMTGDGLFEPLRFNGFPELKENSLAGRMPATFILAPMAMALREQGIPIKIVYLGHRDGTAMMVHKDSKIFRIEDLKGKTVAVPNRFSNQRLLLFKAVRERGMDIADINIVEMPPPDMPAALYARAVDAITSGEPFMAQTEMDGFGRVLYLTKDVWPGFISCVLAVNEEAIKHNRAAVQQLINGIAKSGKWLDEKQDHRMEAAQFVGKNYYNQNPKLLAYVLSKPPDRVKYTKLSLKRHDFEEIEKLGMEAGILDGTAHFEDYCDDSFVPDEDAVQPWAWEGTPPASPETSPPAAPQKPAP